MSDRVTEAFSRIQLLKEKIRERQQTFEKQTHQEVVQALDELNLKGYHVWESEPATHLVCIRFGKYSGPTEFMVRTDDGVRKLIRKAGFVAFAQNAQGYVAVLMRISCVEDLDDVPDTVLLGTVEPSDLDKEAIHEYVAKFLEAEADDLGQKQQSIGFKIPDEPVESDDS